MTYKLFFGYFYTRKAHGSTLAEAVEDAEIVAEDLDQDVTVLHQSRIVAKVTRSGDGWKTEVLA